MPFFLVWDTEAAKTYNELRKRAKKSFENRKKSKKQRLRKKKGYSNKSERVSSS